MDWEWKAYEHETLIAHLSILQILETKTIKPQGKLIVMRYSSHVFC